MTGAVAGLVSVLAVLASAPALAAAPSLARVAVIGAEGEDVALAEIANRTRAELTATGVDARIVACPEQAPACGSASSNPAASGGGLTAVVMTSRRAQQTVSEVQVTSSGGAALVRRITMAAPPGQTEDPAVIAVRAAELVHAALLEAAAPPPAPADEPPVIRYDFEQPRPREAAVKTSGWFAAGGAAFLGGTGLGGAYGVMIRAGYVGVRWPSLTVAALLAAPALAPDLRVPEGKVAVRQELAALEVAHRWRWRSLVQPRVLVGVGAYHLSARGTASGWSTFQGTDGDAWSLMANAGGGVLLALPDGYALFSDAQLVLARPFPLIVYGDRRTAVANPSLLATAGLQRIF